MSVDLLYRLMEVLNVDANTLLAVPECGCEGADISVDEELSELFNMNYSEDVTQDVTQDDVDKKIREMIKSNPNVSTEEMAETLSLSTRTVKRHIKKMPDVQYVGSGYSGHWEIKVEE